MGESQDVIFVTGCPSIDLARGVMKDNSVINTEYLYSKYGGTGAQVDIDRDFVVVMQHAVTTEYEQAYSQMKTTLQAVYDLDIPAVVMWPNMDAGSDLVSKAIREFREKYNLKNFHFFKNFEPEDFLALLIKSKCIIGNSSVGIRECSFLGVPAVNIGTRQDGREQGPNVIDVGHNGVAIKRAARKQLERTIPYPSVHIYGDSNAGKRIAELLATLPLTFEKKFDEWKDFSRLSLRTI
jgi:UDP-hydrolysing UDP-N-acetyl-D-glucosamine 2-epimerase